MLKTENSAQKSDPAVMPPYLCGLSDLIGQLVSRQPHAFKKATQLVAQSLGRNCKLHTFGCGHSALVAAELCYRAGGPACVNFLGLLPGDNGFIAATKAEADGRLAGDLIRRGNVTPGDTVLIISHSGGSALISAVADDALRAGAEVIAVTGRTDNVLAEKSGTVLITGAGSDDCMLSAHGHRFGSMSSALTGILVNTLVASAIELMLEKGEKPLIFKSIHAHGGPMHNQAIIDELGTDITAWRHISSVKEREQNDR
ncbi:MAG: SIS domain-containing protein [bacterium]|nr:SIS domain-containing protein [bacterium]